MMFSIVQMTETNAKQFEEDRLSIAVDYAVEAAFFAAISTDSIGTDYSEGGLETVNINPTNSMPTFAQIMCLNYDMSGSTENLEAVMNSVATAAMFAVDGYYILEPYQVDTYFGDTTDPDPVIGYEYDLLWGVKRPYLVYTEGGTRLFATNLVNETSIEVYSGVSDSTGIGSYKIITDPYDADVGNVLTYWSAYSGTSTDSEGSISDGQVDGVAYDTGLTLALKKEAIAEAVMYDLNYAISLRNYIETGNESEYILANNEMGAFYLPAADTVTGVNDIVSPTLMVFFQNATFLTGYDLDVSSVGGTRVRVKNYVVSFTKNNGSSLEYYCYANQLLGEAEEGNITATYNSLQEAAAVGCHPHVVYLEKSLTKSEVQN